MLWKRLDEPWVERCTLSQGGARGQHPAPWTLKGTAVGASQGVPLEVRYLIHCDGSWATAWVAVTARIGIEVQEVRLMVDDGRWLAGPAQTELPGLKESVDVDLGFTPATNTLPIRRLGLEVGESREIRAAWVRFPELTVEPFPQRYTRLAERRYLFESLAGDFQAELAVDDLGMVVEYQGLWERRAEASSPAATAQPTG